jgi:hypothetical protein
MMTVKEKKMEFTDLTITVTTITTTDIEEDTRLLLLLLSRKSLLWKEILIVHPSM